MNSFGHTTRTSILSLLALSFLSACASPTALAPFKQNLSEVYGVQGGDMLKLRAGPGTGFDVLVGLPNGTVVRVGDCSSIGSIGWCDVALDRAPGLRGYVSQTYIREL